jgi:hypothetical protein
VLGDARFAKVEPRHLDDGDAAQQRLATLAQQRKRCASQKEKFRRRVLAIHENPQGWKEFGGVLHFVDDDQPSQFLQERIGRTELSSDSGIFEIEVVRSVGGNEGPCQSRLANLARADQQHAAKLLEQPGDLVPQILSLDYAFHAA